jgi:TonB family protein
VDVADNRFVAEVEVAIARDGRILDPEWKKSSGHTQWDESVRQALATAASVSRPPPTNFPARVLVRFDVQEVAENSLPLQ